MEVLYSERGEAVINNSLLAAARSRGVADGPRCCGQGFFVYFLFPKKVEENGCLNFYERVTKLTSSRERAYVSGVINLRDDQNINVIG